MNCKIKDTITGRILTGEGIKYDYNFFETKKFMKEFGGDWTKGEVKDPNRVNEDGSPKIVFSSDKRNAFYFDESNRQLPVFNVKFQTLPFDQKAEIANGIVDQLVVQLFETKLDFGTKDIDKALNIDFDIYRFVADQFATFRKMGVTDEINDSFIHSLDDYVELMIRKLRVIGVSYKPGDGIKQAPSFQRNTKDKATARVKFLLNTVVNEDKIFPFVGDSTNYLYETVSPSKVWAVLLPTLSNIPSLQGVNPIEQQLTRLRKAEEGHPWLASIIDILEDAKDNDPQTAKEFFSAFNNIKNRINYTEVGKVGSKKTFKTLNVEDTTRDSRFISKEWMLDFKNHYQNKETPQFRYLRDTIVAESMKSLNDVYRRQFTNNYEDRLEEATEALAPFLEELNIDASTEFVAQALYFWKEDSALTHLTNSDALQKYVEHVSKSINNFTAADWKDDIFDKHLKEFAKAEESVRNDIGLHMVTVGKNRVYLFTLPTMLQEKINELKSGVIDIVDLQKDFPHLKNSQFLNAWKNKTVLKKTYLGLKGVLQMEGRPRDGRDGKNITKGDYIRTDFNNVLRIIKPPNGEAHHSPIYSTQTPADKGREYQISTRVFQEVENTKEAFKIVFEGYIEDELQEMIEARQTIKQELEVEGVTIDEVLENPALYPEEISNAEKRLLTGYHTSKGGKLFVDGVFGGKAFQFGIIQELNKLGWPIFKRGVLTHESLENMRDYYKSKKTQELVEKALQRDVEAFGDRMAALKMGVYVVAGQATPSNIDVTTFNYYRSKYPKIKGQDLYEYSVELNRLLALNYLVNSTMSRVEYSKLFTGSIQYYGNDGSAYIKRVPATYIDGLQPMTGYDDMKQRFNQATFKTESFKSFLSEDIKGLKKEDQLPSHIQDYYEEVDRTDAQGYITIDRWRQLMESIGKMGKEQTRVYKKIKKQWDEVEAGKEITDPLTAADVKVLSAQSLKGVYFENDFGEGPVYLKYSQAVLMPTMAASFPKMKKVADWMKKYTIDELVAQTGVKVGAYKPITLFDKDDNFVGDNDPEYRALDNRNWRLQQDLPTKLIKDNKIGVQIQKIVISRLAFLGDTDLGIGLTGQQLLDAIERTLGELSDKGTDQFMKRYGINEDFTITDKESFYAPIIEDLESKDNVSGNLIEALRSRVPLAALPNHSRTVTSSFMAGIEKAAVDLLTPGGGFIQVSDHLIGKEAIKSSGVKMLTSFSGLKPPRVEMKEGRKVVKPGQVLIPHSLIVKHIPDYQSLTEEELQSRISKDVRQAIGYRIPTQARASVDALEIVGILPIELGDSVIAYGEITAKTGSDFDIDKLFMMFPEMELNEEGTLVAIPEKEIRTKKVQQSYIDETEIITKQDVEVEGIKGIEKPAVVAQFLKTSELVDMDNSLKAKEDNDQLKEEVEELKNLIDCIWG